LKIVHISIFCSNLKIIHILNFIQIKKKKKKKEKRKTVKLMGCGPTTHPAGRGTRPLVPAPPTGGV
jgi:hypothetical protein